MAFLFCLAMVWDWYGHSMTTSHWVSGGCTQTFQRRLTIAQGQAKDTMRWQGAWMLDADEQQLQSVTQAEDEQTVSEEIYRSVRTS